MQRPTRQHPTFITRRHLHPGASLPHAAGQTKGRAGSRQRLQSQRPQPPTPAKPLSMQGTPRCPGPSLAPKAQRRHTSTPAGSDASLYKPAHHECILHAHHPPPPPPPSLPFPGPQPPHLSAPVPVHKSRTGKGEGWASLHPPPHSPPLPPFPPTSPAQPAAFPPTYL